MNEKYEQYDDYTINILMNEPWEISDKPYKLHAAYALSCLFEVAAPEDDDEQSIGRDAIWGQRVPKKILDNLVVDIAESFNDAARNFKQVDIWERRYSIRKLNAFDAKRLIKIFDFRLEDEDYIIEKSGVMNLAGPVHEMLKKYETELDEFRENKKYLRQVIMLAEDDENNGWDKLTDMEIAMYCWALFYNKHQHENLLEFLTKYKKYLYVDENDINDCMTDKARFCQRPQGMYTFSATKVKQWNDIAKQVSYASDIPEKEADDYWYEVALKGNFKPIDKLKEG